MAADFIKQQFELFDQHGNGTINLADLTTVLQILDDKLWTTEKITTLLVAMDQNKNNLIEYSEFVDWIFKNEPGKHGLLTVTEVDMVKQKLKRPPHFAAKIKGEYSEVSEEFDRQASQDLLDQARKVHTYRGPLKEAALKLLDKKADPNVTDKNGASVLMHMTPKMEPPFARRIIDARADVSWHSNNFDSPVFQAASCRNTDMIRLLLMPQTTIVEKDETQEAEEESESETQKRIKLSRDLIGAMSSESPQKIRTLMDSKAYINFKDTRGWTPLTMATFFGFKKNVEVLFLGMGTGFLTLRVDLKNKQGRSALHIAARKNLADLINLLLTKGATVDIKDPDGWTPLHHACYNGNSECVIALIDRGATIDVKSEYGLTPYQATKVRDGMGANLTDQARQLLKVPNSVDYAENILPILKAKKSIYEKIEAMLSLPGVCQNANRLRLHDQFFDPAEGPNKIKLKKVWELIAKPLIRCIRTRDVGMPLLPEDAQVLSEEALETHRFEVQGREDVFKNFLTMWMENTQGPRPSVDWTHENRAAYQEDFKKFMDLELAFFRDELNAVYQKVQEADGGDDLVAIDAVTVHKPRLLTQLGAHPPVEWLEILDVNEAFEQLRLVGALTDQDDDAAAKKFHEMLLYDAELSGGPTFWKNVYRKWLSHYAGLADYQFHQRLKNILEEYNSECEDESLHAVYARGPLKKYGRMIKDELAKGLHASADTIEGRTVPACCLDLIRGTIVVDTPKAVLSVLNRLENLDVYKDRCQLVQVKNYFNKDEEGMHGYRYVELNLLFNLGLTADASNRDDHSLHVALVGEVVIALKEFVAIKDRRSLQYKLWRGFFDWLPQQDDMPESTDGLDTVALDQYTHYQRGNAALYVADDV